MGQDLVLPVAVFPFQIVGEDHLRFIPAEQSHQTVHHLLLGEGVLVFFVIGGGDVREGAQDGGLPKPHDPGPVLRLVLADPLPGGGIEDGALPALFHGVERRDGAHEEHVVVGVHGHHQIVQLFRRGGPGMIVRDDAFPKGVEGAKVDLLLRHQGHGPGPFLHEHGVVDEEGGALLLEQGPGGVELLDAVGAGIVLKGHADRLHRDAVPPGDGYPLAGLQDLGGVQLLVGEPPGVGGGLEIGAQGAVPGQVFRLGAGRFDGIFPRILLGQGRPRHGRDGQHQRQQQDTSGQSFLHRDPFIAPTGNGPPPR